MLLWNQSVTHPVSDIHIGYLAYKIRDLLTNDIYAIEFHDHKCRSEIEISGILYLFHKIQFALQIIIKCYQKAQPRVQDYPI